MPKKIASKLDRYAGQLLAMDDEHKTLAEMQAWLKEEGVTVAPNTIGRFLESLRSARDQAAMLKQIATGSRQCAEIDKAFAKNPAPELETAIKVFKVLIMQLATKGTAKPEFLAMADQLMGTAINAISSQTKAAHKERELKVTEEKFAETKKDEQTKALELCLADAKPFPEVQELFKAAFTALRKAKAK